MESTKQGLVAHCNGGKVRKFADGGKPQETADQIMARMKAKYGVGTGQASPQPALSQPQQQPQPQPMATGQGIVGLIRNRGNQIDRIVNGYANGGVVDGQPLRIDNQLKSAPQESTWDKAAGVINQAVDSPAYNIAQAVPGLNIPLSAIGLVNHASRGMYGDAALDVASAIPGVGSGFNVGRLIPKVVPNLSRGSMMANSMRVGSLAQAAQAGQTGYQVGQQGKDAAGYANGGKIKGPGTPTSDSIPAEVEETGEPIRVANQERILSKAQDDFLANIAKRAGFKSVDAFLEAGTGKPVGPTIKGGKPAAANGLSIDDDFTRAANSDTGLASMIRPFRDAQKQMPDIPPEDAAAYAKQAQPTGLAASAVPPTAAKPAIDSITNMTLANPDAQFMTGKAGAAPDSSGGGFFYDNKAYTVNPSKQEGISKVTANGASPLYTNIKPEDAVSGLKNQSIGGDPQDGLARYAKANEITQSLIDKQPQGGVAVLADPNNVEAANAEKTARWRVDDLISKSKANPAAAQAIAGTVHNQGQAEAGQLAQQTAATGLAAAALRDDKRNALESRGQDMRLKGEEMRVTGNPLDNKAKQAALDQTKQVSDLHTKYLAATDPKEKSALAEQIRGLSGKSNEDDVVVVPGGEFTDPDNPMVKMKQPSMIYNRRTGQYSAPPTQTGGAATQAAPPADKREVGKTYQTPKGPMIWRGQGWEAAK